MLLVGRAVYIAVLVMGSLTFIEVVFPQWVTPVLGIVGLLGLAFGLAFQDVLKNWISGIFLLLERPFRIGDDIRIGDYEGNVETVRLRVTVLRTIDGRRVLVPNQQIYTSVIVDSSSYPLRQFTVVAALTSEQPLADVVRAAAGAIRGIEGVAEDPPSEVTLVPNIEHGPTVEARFWIDVQKFKIRAVQRQVSATLAAMAVGQDPGSSREAATVDVRRPQPAPKPARRPRLPALSAPGRKKAE